MKTKATAGPWRVGSEQNYSVDRYRRNAEWTKIRSATGGLIATVESVHPKGERKSDDYDTETANAAFIVQACNSHAGLVEALRGLLARYVGLVESGDAGFWDAETEDEVKAARAALEKSGVYDKQQKGQVTG